MAHNTLRYIGVLRTVETGHLMFIFVNTYLVLLSSFFSWPAAFFVQFTAVEAFIKVVHQ